MEKTDFINLNLPDEWMSELQPAIEQNGQLLPQWNAVPLFFNLNKAMQRPVNYRSINDQDVREFLFVDAPNGGDMSSFMVNYWHQLSNGKYSFGINYPKNADGTAMIYNLDLSRPGKANLTMDDFVDLTLLHLKQSADKVWEAAGSLTAPNGRRWIPSVFLVNRNIGGAFAKFGRYNVKCKGKNYVIGDIHTMRYNFDIYKPDGTLSEEGDKKGYWSTIAHEFSHNFMEQGDLYGPSGAIGYWDLLGDGCTYGQMSEISSIYKFANDWLTFKEQIFGPTFKKKAFELQPYTTSYEAILVMPDPHFTPHEFFLLEYRKSTGNESWRPDGALTEEGMLIFHVNTMLPMGHTPWNRREAPPIDIEMANFLDNGTTLRIYFEKTPGNLFPQSNNNSFTPFSQPNSNFYGHRNSGLAITNIRVENDVLKFDLEIKGYSHMGWTFTKHDHYLTGRFTADAINEGEEILAWNDYSSGVLHERQGQLNTLYRSFWQLGGTSLSSIQNIVKGDFDGDGLDEIFVRTDAYCTILKFRRGRFEAFQSLLALWPPNSKDVEFPVRLVGNDRQQILVHSKNKIAVWQYDSAGQMEGIVEVSGQLGSMPITEKLKIIPAFLRSQQKQDLLLFNGGSLSLVEYNNSANALEEVAFFNTAIGEWKFNASDKMVTADLDGNQLEEIFVRSAKWMGIIKWQNNQLTLTYIKEKWVIDKSGKDDARIEMKSSDKIEKGRFRIDRDGIYLIKSDMIATLLWDAGLNEMQVRSRIRKGWTAFEPNKNDRYVFGDFHRIGQDINVAEMKTIFDFNTDGLTDIFIADDKRGIIVSPNFLMDGSKEVEQLDVIWLREKQIPLLTPGSPERTVVTAWEDKRGRNQHFLDTQTGSYFSRELFVNMIEEGLYPNYHIRVINGIKTPVSNPNFSEGDNLDRDV
ncbi:MAG: hypothetical protein R2730_08530 [Chitinophagales bacterium]